MSTHARAASDKRRVGDGRRIDLSGKRADRLVNLHVGRRDIRNIRRKRRGNDSFGNSGENGRCVLRCDGNRIRRTYGIRRVGGKRKRIVFGVIFALRLVGHDATARDAHDAIFHLIDERAVVRRHQNCCAAFVDALQNLRDV